MSCSYKDNKYINIEELKNIFQKLKDNVSQILDFFYNKKKIIRFFTGKQLNLIYNNLFNLNEYKNLDLFKVIFNNKITSLKPNTFKFIFGESQGSQEFKNILFQINNYIIDQLNINDNTIDEIYEINKIQLNQKPIQSKNIEKKDKNVEEYKGIYFYMTNKNQEIESLNAYYFLTKNPPINCCYFYCTKNTNKEELRTFLIRCFLCEINSLFCMVNIDLLNSEIRQYFLSFINTYSKKYGKIMQSCLIIIFNGKDDDMHKLLIKIKNISAFPNPKYFSYDFSFDQIFDNNLLIKIIKSTNCGLGKSELIKSQKAQKKSKEKYNYIYFPLGGQFSKQKLIERLENLPDMSDINQKYSIHFDITQTKEIGILNEFFFKLIVLRKCDLNDNAKYFGKNVEIIIEVPNDFKDFTKEIKILSKLQEIKINKIDEIKTSPELINVAKVLTMYETNDILKRQTEIMKINYKLSQEECQNIILKYLKSIEIEKPNYFQINIFIKVLSDEFTKFLHCPGYYLETLLYNSARLNTEDKKRLICLRKFIILSLIKVTRLFLVGPYEKLIKDQEINLKLLNENEEKKEILINNELQIKIDSFSFDEIKPSLIVFNEDEASCTIITTCSEKDIEFKDLENLYNSQNTQNTKKLRSFRNLENNEILDNLLSFLNVSGFNESQKQKILGSYVYTPDNFIKVVLILMRIRVKIPIIMMGETGCGKTTLIEMASKLINKGEIKIKKMNIHAGITNEDIIKFMEQLNEDVKMDDKILLKRKKDNFEKLPEEHKKAYLKKNSKEQIFSEYEKEIKNRKIWIFFDEINTCNSMGLLTEIFCKNSIYGKPLDDRYVYIGACNPYRVSGKENKVFNILYKKQHKKKNLVYTVNPLPISLLNFVFNFGSLKEKDEIIYIKSMISGIANKLFEKMDVKLKEKERNKIIMIETTSVEICQKYMKKNNDISIVSLREVNRFNIFFEFFVNYIIGRKNNKNLIQNSFEEIGLINYYNEKTELEIFICAINLSLFICYYLRLPDKESRKELENLLNEKQYFSEGDFLKIPVMEENYMLNNFDIPKGIAKNRNLKENIFILFFCIINKIPLITCGKPGRSKTLSFQIIQNSMKGEASKTLFCKQYPEMTVFQIQGSLNTTSNEILDIFTKAREYEKNNVNKRIIVVFMDEMGLAEISENNPLKVMHSELEQEKDKISFVGISNWFIDASKMNRVIYNVVQDPDEEDIIETGKEIAKSYEINGENYCEKYENIILRLSKAYFKYINKKKIENDKNQNFHGSRDFYSLVKSILNDIIKNKYLIDKYENDGDEFEKNKLLNKICVNHIMRNFAGLENSIDEFKAYFFEEYDDIRYLNNIKDQNNYNVMKCIQDNIYDLKSRYLLLITESSLSHELLNYILEEINENKNIYKNINNNNIIDIKETDGIDLFNNKNIIKKEIFKKYYSGSKFKDDKNNIMYYNEMLNKIKYQMETDNILILKDLESIYPSLYELFNQTFIYLDNKKFVHLGEFKSLSLVNDKFKVIVLVEKNQIDNQEPPFLNRFEKHIISFSYLLNEELLELAEEIYNTLIQIYKIKIIDKNNNNINVEKKFKKNLKFLREEEIKGLVYLASKKLENNNINNNKNENYNRDDIIKFVLEKISPCFTEELMILLTKFEFRNKYNFYYKFIYEAYKQKYCYNIKNYLEKLDNETSIIYTYSSFFDEIISEEDEIIKNSSSEIEFTKASIKEKSINTISSMNQMDKIIIDFIFDNKDNKNKNKKNLLILKFREEDLRKLNDIYYLLNDYRTTTGKKITYRQSKFVIFVIYLQKDSKTNNYMSFLSNCPQIMISNFNNIYKNFPEILIATNKEMIDKQLFDINSMIDNNIDNALRYFDYNIYNCDRYQNMCYRQTLSFLLRQHKNAKDFLVKSLTSLINNNEDYIVKLFYEEILEKDENSEGNLLNSLYDFINTLVFDNLRKIILILEKENILNTVPFNDLCQNEIIQKYIYDYISKIDNEENKKFNWKNKNLNQKIKINITLGQKLPFCQNIFKSLFNHSQNNIATKYLERDSYFLTTNIKENNISKEIEKYMNEMKKLDDNLKIELYKYNIIIDILNSKNEKLISNLFEDCFYTFIQRNDKLKSNYLNMSCLLNLLIQFRLRSRINNNLNLLFIENKKINLYPSFIDVIKEEIKSKNENENEEKDEENKISDNIYIDKFVSIINFLQSYSKEIHIILEFYEFLVEKISDIFRIIKPIIEEKKIEMEITRRNPHYSRIIKLPFFYIIETLSKILKEKIIDLLNDSKINIYKENDFFKEIQNFIHNLLKLEKRFLLFSKEIFSLDIIIKLISQIQIKNKNNYFTYNDLPIKKLKIFINDFEKDKIVEVLNEQNETLIHIFKDNLDEYSHLMNKILLNYYKSDHSNEIRENIIKKFLLEETVPFNNKLLEYSFPLIQLLFSFSSLEPPQNVTQKNKFKDNFNNNNDSIKNFFSIKNNSKLNEIFLYRFEIICDNYFFKKRNNKDKNLNECQKLCGDLSKIYLEEAIKYFYKQDDRNKVYLDNIYKLYCIAYIKRYFYYFIDILNDSKKYQQFDERKDIYGILFTNKVNQKKTLFIYFLKLLLQKYDNWELFFNNYNQKINENDIFGLKQYDVLIKLEEDESLLFTPNLLLDSQKEFKFEYNDFFSKSILDYKDKNTFNDLFLKNNSYEYLYTFLSNALILYYSTSKKKKFSEKKENYKKLLSSIIEYLNKENKKLDKDILIFINTFFDFKSLNENIFKKIGIIEDDDNKYKNIDKITILLYALRFVFSILVISKVNKNNPEGFYFNLITKNISNVIESSYIPGNFQYSSLKIDSFYQIKALLQANHYNYGAYLCSCGYHYTIDKCTFPTVEFPCPVCKQKIGGTKHIIVRRPGHIRVFFDEESRSIKLKHSYADKEIPNKLLFELENEINLEKRGLEKGFKLVNNIDKKKFLQNQDKIRDMNNITYRFLNFIFYSFLFYSNIQGFLKDKNLNKYVIKSMTCFEIMEKDWKFMNEILENISIEIFLNLIFNGIIEKMITCPKMDTKEKAINFEDNVNEFIINKIKDSNSIKKLKKINDDIININPNSYKALIQEIYPYNKFPDYPDLKYFYISEFPGKEHFILKFNSKEKNKEQYPILNIIINNNQLQEKIKLLKYLPIINKLCNFMINYVSFKYTREEAITIKILDEIKDDEIIKQLNKFILIYKEIRPYIKQHGCHQFGNLFYDLENNLYLSNLCVDSGEMGFGLVLLAMYEEMAEWQNSFINTVINSPNEYLNNYKEFFNSKIMIQDCEEEQIINIPNLDCNLKPIEDNYYNLLENIINNSYRKDSKIIYDYDEIENDLASFILPKIKSFKSEFRKVIYQFECFVGDRSSIIIKFIERYHQRDLKDKELYNVVNYLLENKNNIQKLLISLQVLIDVILDYSPKESVALYSLIEKIEERDNIPNIEIIKHFFKSMNENKYNENYNEIEDYNYFSVNCLISLIDIVELFSWENIRKNLDKRYLEDINSNIKEQFDNHYNENNIEQNNNFIIKKIDFCSALRKFISRYLLGKSEEIINPKNNLRNYLVNIELWPLNFAENDIIDEEINKIFGNADVEIAQAVKLFEYLGGDRLKLDEITKKYNKNKKVSSNINIKPIIEKENPNKIIIDNNEQAYVNDLNDSHNDEEDEIDKMNINFFDDDLMKKDDDDDDEEEEEIQKLDYNS